MPQRFGLLEAGLAISGKPDSAEAVRRTPFDKILNLCDFERPGHALGRRAGSRRCVGRSMTRCRCPRPPLTLAVLDLAALRQGGATTLVHCAARRSRCASVIALYWMARDGLGWEAALARLQARGGTEPLLCHRTGP